MGPTISKMKQTSQDSGNNIKLPIQCVENPKGFGAVVLYGHETRIMTEHYPLPIQCVENPEGFGAVVVYGHETRIMTKHDPTGSPNVKVEKSFKRRTL